VSRSSLPLRPDPPVSPAPPDFTSSAYTGGRARQLGLGCERHLPCFGSVLLPHVPSPLRREENQGLIPALRPCSRAFPTKTVSRLLQCSRHRLPSGPFSRRFFRCSLCYGPRGCSPSWTDPTWRDIALRPPRTFLLPELSRGRSPSPRVGYRYTAPGGGHRDRTFTGWSTAVTGCTIWRRTPHRSRACPPSADRPR
jgi:hypothetical protein